jgi:hypothetical protein
LVMLEKTVTALGCASSGVVSLTPFALTTVEAAAGHCEQAASRLRGHVVMEIALGRYSPEDFDGCVSVTKAGRPCTQTIILDFGARKYPGRFHYFWRVIGDFQGELGGISGSAR